MKYSRFFRFAVLSAVLFCGPWKAKCVFPRAWAPTDTGVAAFSGYGWEAGSSYLYHVIFTDFPDISWFSGLARGGSGSSASRISFRLDAVVRFKCVEISGDKYRFAVSFKEISTLEIRVSGQELAGQGVIGMLRNNGGITAEYSPDGRLKRIERAAGSDDLKVRLLASVAGELQAMLPGDRRASSWSGRERHFYGTGNAVYSGKKQENNALVLEKIVTVSESEGKRKFEYLLTIDRNGLVKKIVMHSVAVNATRPGKSLAPQGTSILLELLAVVQGKTADSERARGGDEYDITGSAEKEKALRNILEKEAADINPRVFRSWIWEFQRGHVRDGNEIFIMKTRMAALLALHPELCAGQERLFLELPSGSAAREVVLGVLVLAGGKEAQKTILDILSAPSVRSDKNFVRLVQAPAFLQHPAPFVAAYYRNIIENRKEPEDIRLAAIHTLGSIVWELRRSGQTGPAKEFTSFLVERLHEPDAGLEEADALLHAMRNTHDPENTEAVRPFLGHGSERIRFAAVRALGAFGSARSKRLLIDTLSDTSYLVRNGVLQSLVENRLSRHEMVELETRIVSGVLKQETDPMLLELLQKEMLRYPELVRESLEAMFRRGIPDRETAFRASEMLKALEAGQGLH